MDDDAVEAVGNVRAMRAARVPARIEHEVIDDELTSVFEEIGQRFLTLRTVEEIFLLDFLPRKLAPLTRDVVLQMREVFFFLQQRDARLEPLLMRDDRMILHARPRRDAM